jgi:hypothetical protein
VLQGDTQSQTQHGFQDGAEDRGGYRLDGDHRGQLLSAKFDRPQEPDLAGAFEH